MTVQNDDNQNNGWQDYDPTWLVDAAQADTSITKAYPWLVEALTQCTKAKNESAFYTYFVESKNPNKAGSAWQFSGNITIESSQHGEVVLDVLTDNRIGGVEFLSRLFEKD